MSVTKRQRLALISLFMILLAFGPRTLYAADPITVYMSLPAISSLDPVSLARTDTGGRAIVGNLFVGLTRYDAATGKVLPWLASSWTISDDNLVYTFTLRHDIQWVKTDPATQQVEAVRSVSA